MAIPAPLANRLAATNWDAPAKTKRLRPIVAAGEIPVDTLKAPNMMPKGIAPITRGRVSLNPAQNSFRVVIIGFVSLYCMDFIIAVAESGQADVNSTEFLMSFGTSFRSKTTNPCLGK